MESVRKDSLPILDWQGTRPQCSCNGSPCTPIEQFNLTITLRVIRSSPTAVNTFADQDILYFLTHEGCFSHEVHVCWYPENREELRETINNCCSSHIRTWKYKWKSWIFVSNIEELFLLSVPGRGSLKSMLKVFKCLSSFYEMSLLVLVILLCIQHMNWHFVWRLPRSKADFWIWRNEATL